MIRSSENTQRPLRASIGLFHVEHSQRKWTFNSRLISHSPEPRSDELVRTRVKHDESSGRRNQPARHREEIEVWSDCTSGNQLDLADLRKVLEPRLVNAGVGQLEQSDCIAEERGLSRLRFDHCEPERWTSNLQWDRW